MGDRDYRHIIKNVIENFNQDIKPQINAKDNKTIHFSEVNRCLRRSYFDRMEPKEQKGIRFSDLFGEILQKLPYGSTQGEFSIEDIKLKIDADIIVDDVVIVFRLVTKLPEKPLPADTMYLNACLWILNKTDGLVVYLTENGDDESFSFVKEKKMFEESVRRVRILSDLLEEKKIPVLEPSSDCSTCQYYEECYIKKRLTSSFSIESLFGLKEEEK